eukprot:TRINITY_DN14498_c0_g4_i1.p1 TRINITY_DN14498_c0_g4~~TRINITY_DN14498_c0_g4_i1.p1  ORF type:complete len:237 (-),score=22.63 TRINITY_DN14498_c0_g4_i1:54-764(-)
MYSALIPLLGINAEYMGESSLTCPNTASQAQRALMFFIGAIYLARATVLRAQRRELVEQIDRDSMKSSRGYIKALVISTFPEKEATSYGGTREDRAAWNDVANASFNRTTGMLDDLMNNAFEHLVYVLNLWVVFVTPEVQDMVLNTLALEFIMDLDNQFVEQYWVTSGRAARYVYQEMYPVGAVDEDGVAIAPAYGKGRRYKRLGVLNLVEQIIEGASALAYVALMMYGTICKAST